MSPLMLALLLFGAVSMITIMIALFVAWTRAEREVDQLRQRLNDLLVRRGGLG